MHAVLSLSMEFLPKLIIDKMCDTHAFKQLVSNHLSPLPGYCYRLYCSCDKPNSLECRSRSIVVKQLVNRIGIKTSNWVPWVNCCSLLSYVCLNPGEVRLLTFWKFMYHKVMSIVQQHLAEYSLYGWENKVVCVFTVSEHVCIKLLAECHGKINVPEGKGYHLFPVEHIWRMPASATLNSGRTCSLRYIKIRGVEIQERVIKKKLNAGSRSMLKLMSL